MGRVYDDVPSVADRGVFRGPEICELAGITYRQLDFWARTDLIRPSIADAKGSGSQRIYSREDLGAFRVVRELLDLGFDLPRIRGLMPTIRDLIGQRHERPLMLVVPGAVYGLTYDEALERFIDGAPLTVLINLSALCVRDTAPVQHDQGGAKTSSGVSSAAATAGL